MQAFLTRVTRRTSVRSIHGGREHRGWLSVCFRLHQRSGRDDRAGRGAPARRRTAGSLRQRQRSGEPGGAGRHRRGSVVAAKESEEALAGRAGAIDQLEPHLQSLGYQDEISSLQRFRAKFDECRKLDAEILPLAVENTNLKAQRLSFGEAQEIGGRLRCGSGRGRGGIAIGRWSIAGDAGPGQRFSRMQVLQARHIAEANDTAMDRMEQQMATLGAECARGGGASSALEPARSRRALESATAALDRFVSVNQQIVATLPPQHQRALACVDARSQACRRSRGRGSTAKPRRGARRAHVPGHALRATPRRSGSRPTARSADTSGGRDPARSSS